MDKQTGWLINSFDFWQPITDVYCGQLTNKRAPFLQHSIYDLLVHEVGFAEIFLNVNTLGETLSLTGSMLTSDDTPAHEPMVRVLTFIVGVGLLIIHHFNHRYIRKTIR